MALAYPPCAASTGTSPATLKRSSSQESLLGLEAKDKYVIVQKSKLEALAAKASEAKAESAAVPIVNGTVVPSDRKSDITDADKDSLSKPVLLRSPMTRANNSGAKMMSGTKGKLRQIEVIIPYSVSATTAASGLLTSTLSIDPSSNATEWASLSTLYDEYKVIDGLFRFSVVGRCPLPGSSGLTSDSNFVVVYDPTDTNSLSSWRNGTEYSQHCALFPTLITGGSSAANDIYGIRTGSKGAVLQFTVPKGSGLATSSGAINYGGDVWFAVASTVPCGQLKFYWQTANTTSASAVTGVMYLRVHLRSRA